jgi:hypothetical protein
MKLPSPKVYYDPWKSDETTVIFIASINGDNPQSFQSQQLEENENIKIVKFDIDENLLDTVVAYGKEHHLHIEAKVFSICLGLWLKSNLHSL